MSEGTDASAPGSGTDESGQVAAPRGKSKRNLWLIIAAIVVAALLIGTAAFVMWKPTKTPTLKVSIVAQSTAEAGEIVGMRVDVSYDDQTSAAEKSLTDKDAGVTIRWSVTPSNAGDFDRLAKSRVNMTAAPIEITANVSCKVTYEYDAKKPALVETDYATLTINAPFLDSVAVLPSTKTIPVGGSFNFTATAVSSVGLPMTGIDFTWTVSGMPSSDYTLNRTAGKSVRFTGLAVGNATLNATATAGGITKTGSANISTTAGMPPRSVDYRWYDFFNVPFGQWWDKRWDVYQAEKPWSRSYPYIFEYHGAPPGNIIYYSNVRLNVTARNMTEVNMNERPEFLPLFGTERGGNVVIDWYQQYLSQDEVMARIPATASWNDGWFINWKGTTTLDKQAAKAVMGITEAQYNDFANWWAANNATFGTQYQNWITQQSAGRLDIHPAYDGDMNWVDWNFWAEKVGSNIVMHLETTSWGMDMMMSRWMWDSFMPTEWYYEDFNFHARIGPERADADIDTAVAYGLVASESKLIYPGRTHGDPVWFWQAMMQDYMFSEPPAHPHSLYDVYAGGPTSNGTVHNYTARYPGNMWYGQNMTYDIVPGAWNLSENETLSFEWPSGPQLFLNQLFNETGAPVLGKTYNTTANLTMNYFEPDTADIPSNAVISGNNLTYIGPFDMWHWSKNQITHSQLASEWGRVGLLPRGAPYIEWKNESAAEPPRPSRFQVSGIPSPIKGGTPASVTVTAFDQYNNVMTTYTGIVHFTSSDPAAALPADYQFDLSDDGVHTFTGGVTFHNTGAGSVTQSVTVTDTVQTSVTGSQTGIVVQPDPHAATMDLSGMPGTVTAGQPTSVTVTVRDQYGVVYTPYSGTVNFTSNRSDVVLPANYAFVPGDAGVHVFASELNFSGLGYYALTCSDVASPTINGTKTGIYVVGLPPYIDHFEVYGPAEVDESFASSLRVMAKDQYDRVFDTYNGTIHLSTNATLGEYTLPADYTFVPGDLGDKTFTGGMIFSTPGWYRIDVADIINTTATGNLTGIHVLPRAPEIKYKLYDIFEEPFGQWWWGNSTNYKGRIVKYGTDSILWNETHKHTFLYNPNPLNQHALIMAPYHWSTDATNISWITVSNSYVMPERFIDYLGTPAPIVAGAVAKIDLRMQYIDEAWWWGYWAPTLIAYGVSAPMVNTYLKNQGEGYLVGTVYKITMNREAALQWLNLSLTESDVAAWWSIYSMDYEIFWRSWVVNQGKVAYDIWSGYEDIYWDNFWAGSLTEDIATGDVELTISHVNWGYEVLMARWLSASGLCNHEVYWENFTLNATYNTQYSDVHFDATGTYNLHAVKANASAGNDGAWVWEPCRIDYVPSWTDTRYHHSDYDPYTNLTYQSWNAGDTAGFWANEVHYDSTPTRFNLTNYMTFTVELPKGSNVPAYYAQSVPVGSVTAARLKNVANYTALEYNGTASLGFTLPNLSSMYNPATQTLTMTGPMDFDNPRGAAWGLLYHGAPWIEFNVTSTLKALSADVVQPGAASTGPSAEPAISELVSIAAVATAVLLSVAALGAVRRLN